MGSTLTTQRGRPKLGCSPMHAAGQGRRAWRGRAFAACLVVAALATGLFAGLASAAPGDFTATLHDTAHSFQSGASGSATCDSTNSQFVLTVTGVATSDPSFPPGSNVYAKIGGGTPPTPFTGVVAAPSDRFSSAARSPACAGAGTSVEFFGPGSDDPSGLDMVSTLQASAPSPHRHPHPRPAIPRHRWSTCPPIARSKPRVRTARPSPTPPAGARRG